ncbi:hypothetical protein B0H14DRAFT_2586998 [Mycena olivaceomarginata]|nr:hypothetical protein B0H14DRAFT_2586998 [Mycena olivaceomarginata]
MAGGGRDGRGGTGWCKSGDTRGLKKTSTWMETGGVAKDRFQNLVVGGLDDETEAHNQLENLYAILVWGSDGAVTGFRGVFISVIRAMWLPDWAEDQKFAHETEQSWAMAMTALSNAWATLELSKFGSCSGIHSACRVYDGSIAPGQLLSCP